MTRQAKKPLETQVECHAGVREILDRIGDKWSILTIHKLAGGKCRFSELLRNGHGISQRMLTTTLRACERDGLVKRYSYPEIPPRVEYELTPLGQSLINIVKQIIDWAQTQWSEIEGARQAYDLQQQKPID